MGSLWTCEMPKETTLFIEIEETEGHYSGCLHYGDRESAVELLSPTALGQDARVKLKGHRYTLGELVERLVTFDDYFLHQVFDERGQLELGRYLYAQTIAALQDPPAPEEAARVRVITRDEHIARLPWVLLARDTHFLAMTGWSMAVSPGLEGSAQELPASPSLLLVMPEPADVAPTQAIAHLEELEELLSASDHHFIRGQHLSVVHDWEAFEAALAAQHHDEIDKAPRDFPNDLLHELDQMEFTVTETGQTIKSAPGQQPIVFITSNSERRLPEPFLRRCVYHHIRFDDTLVSTAVEKHRKALFPRLSDEFIKLAIARFLKLREKTLRKTPATGELLVWLRVLALAAGTYPERLPEDLAELPYLGALLKDHQDIEELGRG
jgi:hypothetical protein